MSICVVGVCSSVVQHTVNRTEGTICLPQLSSVHYSSILLVVTFLCLITSALRHCNVTLRSQNTQHYATYNSISHLRCPHLRSALFWDIMQRIVLIPSRRFGPIFKGQESKEEFLEITHDRVYYICQRLDFKS
jgi:hypothetical protein